MRKKKLAKNTASSLILEVSTLVCGFILPKLILVSYGSNVNGLVNSITQFLKIIAFLQLGVGAVVESALYKPLAEQNNRQISEVMASAAKFFRNIGRILLVYVIFLVAVYPFLVNKDFGFLYTAILILAMSISSFAQYYFGIVDGLLLSADQRGYIQNNTMTITLLVNTGLCVIFIQMGSSIQLVKLVTSLVFLCRPLILRWYVNRHYAVDRKVQYQGEPIKQKWNGIAQHVSSVVLEGTDTIVLTIFDSLGSVSVYSVYHLVVYGIKTLTVSLMAGVQSLLGEYYAKGDYEKTQSVFERVEWITHTFVVLIFGCTATLIVPFVQVYTKGVTDIDYRQPVFAAVLVAAYASYCLRSPYHIMIKVAGHYRETQNNYIIATVMNLMLSVVTVSMFGLVGVAVGTLAGMAYQTVWMAVYTSKKVMNRSLLPFCKQLIVDAITVTAGVFATGFLEISELNYISWVFLAMIVFAIWLAVTVVMNIIFYGNFLRRLKVRLD